MYILARKHGVLARKILLEEVVHEGVDLGVEDVEMVHAIFLRGEARLILREGEHMARCVDLGDDVDKLCGSLLHECAIFSLGVMAVLGSEAGVGVTLKTEDAGGLHPVIVKILLKAIVVKMKLERVHLIVGHDACQLLDVWHGHKLTAHIEHEATDGILRHVDS